MGNDFAVNLVNDLRSSLEGFRFISCDSFILGDFFMIFDMNFFSIAVKLLSKVLFYFKITYFFYKNILIFYFQEEYYKISINKEKGKKIERKREREKIDREIFINDFY